MDIGCMRDSKWHSRIKVVGCAALWGWFVRFWPMRKLSANASLTFILSSFYFTLHLPNFFRRNSALARVLVVWMQIFSQPPHTLPPGTSNNHYASNVPPLSPVHPIAHSLTLSRAFTFAPFAINKSHTAVCPAFAARCSGVQLCCREMRRYTRNGWGDH